MPSFPKSALSRRWSRTSTPSTARSALAKTNLTEVSWFPRRIASRGGARSGRGGEAPRFGALEDIMTTEQKIIRAKVGLLELAKQLGNSCVGREKTRS